MWSDNESEIDLLGFKHLVSAAQYLLMKPEMLPVTIGVFGDWGSGKSSLIKMIQKQLEQDSRSLCVSFSPWQYESYDDVKTALMFSVISSLKSRHLESQSATDKAASAAKDLLDKLLERIDWFRLAGLATKGVAGWWLAWHGHPFVGAEMLKGVIAESKDAVLPPTKQPTEPIEQSIGQFREDFKKLLECVDIDRVVVFVDDLDRCLPPAIIDTFEAIRLFLSVPKTAFVLGADELIVRHAIGTRYPEMGGQALDVGRNYLEKIVQLPIRIPPMTAGETEAYLNLLGCHSYEASRFDVLVAAADQNRHTSALDVAMNYGIAKTHIGNVPSSLEAHMQLVARIAPTLSNRLRGNPRLTKRFMNTLMMRYGIAGSRKVTLRPEVLAKLMILEYFYEPYYRELFQWQAEGQGYAHQLVDLEERAAMHGQDRATSASLSGSERWIDDQQLASWLRLEPPLATVNLDPYFYFSRDRGATGNSVEMRRLSQQQQTVLANLLADSDSEGEAGKRQAKTFAVDEFRPVYEQLLARFQRDSRASGGRLGKRIVELAAERRELVPALAKALAAAPVSGIASVMALTIPNSFPKESLPPALQDVLREWSSQRSNTQLAAAAERALSPKQASATSSPTVPRRKS
ncbi:Predicted P-loop ATPase [Sorangium cellulosum So ce56]|uniref:Predicted P-loop ATPase n=2 Tax=Sorangium cellulosum TaxID=56 RepID=A9GG04_SORC5|nr:Predicted P-loop ATPase [Sorangium cellulosum So ce56]